MGRLHRCRWCRREVANDLRVGHHRQVRFRVAGLERADDQPWCFQTGAHTRDPRPPDTPRAGTPTCPGPHGHAFAPGHAGGQALDQSAGLSLAAHADLTRYNRAVQPAAPRPPRPGCRHRSRTTDRPILRGSADGLACRHAAPERRQCARYSRRGLIAQGDDGLRPPGRPAEYGPLATVSAVCVPTRRLSGSALMGVAGWTPRRGQDGAVSLDSGTPGGASP